MIDHLDVQLTLRARATTLEVCTTGSTTLAATSTGYTRPVGSFVTDGFAPGMEITASGFATAANNGTGLVTNVTATVLSVTAYTVAYSGGELVVSDRTLVAEGAGSGRTVLVGLPAMRAWENLVFDAHPGVPWIEEQYLPGPTVQRTIGPKGTIEMRPQYVLAVHVVEGSDIAASKRYVDALLNHFAPRTNLTLTNGDTVRVRLDASSFAGQMRRRRPGWASTPVTFPLRLFTVNTN
jgi:hypothetical protein